MKGLRTEALGEQVGKEGVRWGAGEPAVAATPRGAGWAWAAFSRVWPAVLRAVVHSQGRGGG